MPCWSSWKTGMSSSSLRRSSISKQRGAEMSSRLMPPNPGAISLTAADDLVGVGRLQADREGVDAGELLEQAALALHHRHRRPGADVAQAEHGRAVGDDGDGVALDRVLEGLVFVVGDRQADARDAGRVDHREVVAGLQGVLVGLFDLAADVQQEGAVGRIDHLGTPEGADGGEDEVPVLAPRRRPLPRRAGCCRRRPRRRRPRRRSPPASPMALVTRPSSPGLLVELDANRQAVLRARCGAHWPSSSVVGGTGC